jgi:hypothetical protein
LEWYVICGHDVTSVICLQGVAIGGGIGSINDILEASHLVNKQVWMAMLTRKRGRPVNLYVSVSALFDGNSCT